MAQVIELAGESNPLTPQNVLNSVIQAASSTQQQVQTATKQLQYWEKQEKYYTFLQVRVLLQTPYSRSLTLIYCILTAVGCVSRSISPPRSSVPRYHPDEERNR